MKPIQRTYYVEVEDLPIHVVRRSPGTTCYICNCEIPKNEQVMADIYFDFIRYYCDDYCWVPELRT